MGQNTPTAAPPSSSRTSFLFQLLTGHRKSSESPQTIPKKAHSTHNTKMGTTLLPPFNLSAQKTAHLTACVGGATPPPHNHTHFTPLLPFLSPNYQHDSTGVVCLINCHGLNFDIVPRPLKHLDIRGQR